MTREIAVCEPHASYTTYEALALMVGLHIPHYYAIQQHAAVCP